MHGLCRSFSQRRKPSKQPQDIHIHKPSLSGSSLSSDGFYTTPPSSASTARAPPSSRSAIFDPLALHPTGRQPHQPSPPLSLSPSTPPPRLHERPILVGPEWRRLDDDAATFFDDGQVDRDVVEDDYFGRYAHGSVYSYGPGCDYKSGYGYGSDWDYTMRQMQQQSPPLAAPMDHSPYGRRATEPHNMYMPATKRPQLPRSRWSESTIDTLGSLAGHDDDEDDEDDVDLSLDSLESGLQQQQEQKQQKQQKQQQQQQQQQQAPQEDAGLDAESFQGLDTHHHHHHHYSMPNFSYKRATVPRRPPIRTLDSLEDFIKRGGWKRRGIVFQSDEVDGAI